MIGLGSDKDNTCWLGGKFVLQSVSSEKKKTTGGARARFDQVLLTTYFLYFSCVFLLALDILCVILKRNNFGKFSFR